LNKSTDVIKCWNIKNIGGRKLDKLQWKEICFG